MKRLAPAAVAVALLIPLASCSSGSDSGDRATPAGTPNTRTVSADDVSYLEENLSVVAGNVVTTVNNARDYGFEGENADDGGVYDVASYHDRLAPACKPEITRSEFRADFLDRVVPLIDDARPERITVAVDTANSTAVAKVEQESGRTLLMDFEIEGTSEDFACNDNGTIAIHSEGGASSGSAVPEAEATVTVTQTERATGEATVPEPEVTDNESCLAPGIPPEWDKNGDCMIDTDAPIG